MTQQHNSKPAHNIYGADIHGAAIVAITPLEILDSRGGPTLQVRVQLASGASGVARVPAGASTGRHEAVEWRDGDKARFQGRGLLQALAFIKGDITDLLIGQDATDQLRLDNLLIQLDGSDNKKILGANTLLAVSLAMAHAAAAHHGQPLYRYVGGATAHTLPVPMMNIINGGVHADNNIDIQEFMIMPVGFTNFSEALRAGVEIFHALKSLLKTKKLSTNVGDEGGFAPQLSSAEEALTLLGQAVSAAGYKEGRDIFYALDCASTEFFKDGHYQWGGGREQLTAADMVAMLTKLCDQFPILSIEDGMAEDDLEGWGLLTKKLGARVQLVGDDLFVTNPARLHMGMEKNLANALLVKVNQIGTLTETWAAVQMALHGGYGAVMSHRSGETEDTTIADLAVASHCGQIKTGAPSRGERTAKYNRLLEIEQQLGHQAHYHGAQLLRQRR